MISFDIESLDFSRSNGLITVVAQDSVSGLVLMVAHADRDALARTIETGEMHYTSRTRGPWHKGATSGNTQQVVSLFRDCDGDAVLARVIPAGPACHTMTRSCFGHDEISTDHLTSLSDTIERRALEAETSLGSNPSYTVRLLNDRNLRLKKIGEEATELVTACADNDGERAAEEAADLVYHMLVALRSVGVSLSDVRQVLARRTSNRLPGAPVG